jgi:AcrR family transcriptional regulator
VIESEVQIDGPVELERMPSGRYLQKRDQILDAASRKFNTLGVRGATLEEIARDVGMNLTSIRHYFRRKDDLVAAAFLHSIAIHTERLVVALEAGDREARVRSLVSAYFNLRRSIREGAGPDVMLFGDMRSLSDEHAALVWPRYHDLFAIVRRVVAEPAEFNADRQRVNARAYYLISQLFRSVFWLPSYPTDSLGWVETKFTDILFNGLAASGIEPALSAPLAPDRMAPAGSSWESFLLAATMLINEQGYRGASVDAIARKLNRTKGSFYHYVEGKGDLLTACFNRSLGVLQEAQRNAIATETRGLNQAFSAVADLVRRQQTPAGPLLRSSALMSVDAGAREHMLGELAQVVTRFSGMVTDAIIDGSGRPCDPRVAGEMIMVTVNSAAQLHNWAKHVTPEHAVDLYARQMFKGLFS